MTLDNKTQDVDAAAGELVERVSHTSLGSNGQDGAKEHTDGAKESHINGAKDQELHSNTEDEEDEDDEDEDEDGRGGPIEYPGTVLPDDHPQKISHDADLAAEFGPDSKYLDLIHLKITSLEDLSLERFTQLESLCLRQNLLTSMSGVSALSPEFLEELDLYDNRINHISSSVDKLHNLQTLDLSFNKIKNIKNISSLTKLQNLYFVQNKIRDIKNLDTLVSLRNLELGGNKISKLENLDRLAQLTQLWVGKNKIEKLENLDGLSNLRVLSIQSNRLTKIEGLDKLENLEELYLSHNGISKIENLEHNKNLTIIDITSNKLSHLENLSHLTNLTDFWCSYNQISSFEEINRELGKLPELDTVYFEGNPVQLTAPTAYRRKLKLNLGDSLTKIDATYIK